MHWQNNPGDRKVRVLYNQSGAPTAAVLENGAALVDYTLYWIACKDINEANYLVAVINSRALFEAVAPLMPKGQFGARHLQKHLWKLPIPAFDLDQELHITIAEAGAGAAGVLENLREQRGDKLTVKIARRELREWLGASDQGQAVGNVVSRLLTSG